MLLSTWIVLALLVFIGVVMFRKANGWGCSDLQPRERYSGAGQMPRGLAGGIAGPIMMEPEGCAEWSGDHRDSEDVLARRMN